MSHNVREGVGGRSERLAGDGKLLLLGASVVTSGDYLLSNHNIPALPSPQEQPVLNPPNCER